MALDGNDRCPESRLTTAYPGWIRSESSRVEIVLRNGRRVLVGTCVDLPALVFLVEALDRQ